MFSRLASRFSRLMMAAFMLVGLMAALPKPVSAAFPVFDIITIKANESVTIRTHNFPAHKDFTVRMDKAGNLAIDGIAVAEINSGSGGEFDLTIKIPAELKDTKTIAIRLESDEGYFAYNWFSNRTTAPMPGTIPATGETTGKPYINVLAVKSNETATFEVVNMAAYTTLTVRVGPFHSFYRDYATAPSVRTDANGYVKFSVALPDVVDDVEMVTVRVDGGGHYAFNAFKNADSGTVSPITSTTSGACLVVSVTPTKPVSKGADLDLIWTVKNTSSSAWNASSVDYKYVSGSNFSIHGDRYDMRTTVNAGDTVKIIVDALAPKTAGYYTTNWALVSGSTTLCNLSATLRVK